MPDKLKQFSLFMKMSWEAHDDQALLYLIRLFDRNSKSVGIHYLLRVAKSNPQLFQHIDRKSLLETIEKDVAHVDGELASKLESLKAHRDTHVVHSDKDLLSGDVDLTPTNPLSRSDIEMLYQEAIEILNR